MIARKIIAEHLGDGAFMCMDDDGHIAEFTTSARLVAAVKRSGAALQVKTGETIVTTIEYRNVTPADVR